MKIKIKQVEFYSTVKKCVLKYMSKNFPDTALENWAIVFKLTTA